MVDSRMWTPHSSTGFGPSVHLQITLTVGRPQTTGTPFEYNALAKEALYIPKKNKEEFMRSKLFQVALLIVALTVVVPSILFAAENPSAVGQGGAADDKKYAGEWAGSYSGPDGNGDKLSYTLSKDEKGQWRGTVKWVNQNGENKADFKSLEIADGKMKGRIEDPNGQVEVAIEGQFQGDKLEGTFAISAKGSTEVVERGTWKVAKSPAAKTGQ
jgi:hypothetical protein